MNLVENNIEKIRGLCKTYKVAHLYVFGSVLTDKFNADSDIDLMVAFNDIGLYEYADNYFDLKFALEKTLNRNIDLLEEKALKNPYLKESIDASKKMIYG